MKVENKTLIITDPCYFLKGRDKEDLMDYLPGDFKDYILESTIYGDWSCTTFVGRDLNIPVGLFCADAGLVAVVLAEDLLKYNPGFFKEHGTHTYTAVSNFTGNVEYEIDENDEAHIVGYYPDGSICFKTMQTGL